jgi:hypothetical protein
MNGNCRLILLGSVLFFASALPSRAYVSLTLADLQSATLSASAHAGDDGLNEATGTDQAQVHYPAPDYPGTTNVTAFATAQVFDFNQKIITRAVISSNTHDFPAGQANAEGSLAFQFAFVPGDNSVTLPEDVPAIIKGTYTPDSNTSTGAVFTMLNITDARGNVLFNLDTSTGNSYFDLLYFVPNTAYTLSISASASVFDTVGEVDANIDPMFVIDPSFANDFHIILSPGVGNGVTGAVPEISTWAMMLLGFCGLGFVAHRRGKHLARSLIHQPSTPPWS